MDKEIDDSEDTIVIPLSWLVRLLELNILASKDKQWLPFLSGYIESGSSLLKQQKPRPLKE